VNEDFIRPRLWFRNVQYFQDLGTTVTIDDNSFHGFLIVSHGFASKSKNSPALKLRNAFARFTISD